MSTSFRARQEKLRSVSSPLARQTMRAGYHLRRHALLYVVGGLSVLALSFFPTLASGGGNAGEGAGGAARQATNAPSNAAAAQPAGVSGSSAGGPSSGSSPSAGSGAGASSGSQTVQVGAGVTRGGYKCQPGVRQIPFSQYADPCEAMFTGNNGGATHNGVTGDTITIAVRHTSDSQGANAATVDAESQAAGGATATQDEQYMQQLVGYFNKTIELYGRQVKLVDFNGQSNYTNEELGQDETLACSDADALATSVHAFGVIDFQIYGEETQPLSECAARYGVYVPLGAPYYSESQFQQWNPYVWNVTPNCNLIAEQMAEFTGKQLAPYPAQWAGLDGAVNMQNAPRTFAIYVPNNAGYQGCQAQAQQIEQNQYHISSSRQDPYAYGLDVSTFPQDAQRAIIQFSAHHDTTLVLACDPISPIFLTQDAVQQNYHPEWLLEGVAQTDWDNWAQLWNPQEVNGHLFGLSQAGSTQSLLDPNSESGRVLSSIGVPINITSVTSYYLLLSMFNQLQAAGPDLTPANIAAGTARLPVAGGSTGALGTWDFGNTHTAIVDAREVYWDGSTTSPADGKPGTYLQIYNGKRFQVGQFPTGQPPYYP